MSRAYLIRADGTFDRNVDARANFVRVEDRWYRLAGVARDRNTTYDSVQLCGADGQPNNGCAVYIEIPKPDLATVSGACVELARGRP